jgi:hypothetical protein
MTNTNPLAGLVSVCCGREHDIHAEHGIKNETAIGGCSYCGKYAEFEPAENSIKRKQVLGLATLNSFVPDMSDYHLDLR